MIKVASIIFEGIQIRYSISRKAKKNISIRIKDTENIIISAPYFVSEEDIKKLVLNKAKWILEKLEIVKNRGKIAREYIEGEIFMYLGKEYRLRYRENSELNNMRIILEEDSFYFEYSNRIEFDKEDIKKAMEKWYKIKGENFIKKRMNQFSKVLGLKAKQVSVRKLKSNWGLCYGNGNITMNLKLIGAPTEVIDYVIVHELCHLEHHNHSKRYWDFVLHHMPNYKERSQWLKVNGYRLEI